MAAEQAFLLASPNGICDSLPEVKGESVNVVGPQQTCIRLPLRVESTVAAQPALRIASYAFIQLREQGRLSPRVLGAITVTENAAERVRSAHSSCARFALLVAILALMFVLVLSPLFFRRVLASLTGSHYQPSLVYSMGLVVSCVTPLLFILLRYLSGMSQRTLQQLNEAVQREVEADAAVYSALGFDVCVEHRSSNACNLLLSSVPGPVVVLYDASAGAVTAV